MGISFNEILVSDLRDSAGHTMKVLEVSGVEGNYPTGGIPLVPADFGFTEILHVSIQSDVIAPNDFEDPFASSWTPLAHLCAARTDLELDGPEWRLIVLLYPGGYGGAQGDGMAEPPDGAPMQFIPQNQPTMMMIGY